MALSEGIESELRDKKNGHYLISYAKTHHFYLLWKRESSDLFLLDGAYVSSSPVAFSTSWLGESREKKRNIVAFLTEFYDRSIKTN